MGTSVTIKRKTEQPSGQFDLVSVGTYNVHLEHVPTVASRQPFAFWSDFIYGNGMFFLFENIDLNDCFVEIDGKDYAIVRVERYVDGYGNFHHLEVFYAE